VIVSLLFGSARGLVWEWARRWRNRRSLQAPPLPGESGTAVAEGTV